MSGAKKWGATMRGANQARWQSAYLWVDTVWKLDRILKLLGEADPGQTELSRASAVNRLVDQELARLLGIEGIDDPKALYSPDHLTRWIGENCTDVNQGVLTQARPLYNGYRQWLRDQGYSQNVTEATFGRQLREAGIFKKKRSDASYYALTLKQP